MRVAFRVDSSVALGSGHLMRCLTLAAELRKRGANIVFICSEQVGNLTNRLVDAGFQVYRLPQSAQDAIETQAILKTKHYDWLVVDHYGLDRQWEEKLRPYVDKICVIDDLADREHDCDILLDQNYFGEDTTHRYKDLTFDACHCLLGPKYALLQSDYFELRSMHPPHDGSIRRVLIFFGATDQSNQTKKVLLALSKPEFGHLIIEVVLGVNHPDPEGIMELVQARSETTLHRSLPSLAELMARADFMIGAGGTTTWERLTLGLPALVVDVAENQSKILEALSKDGFQSALSNGSDAEISEWQEKIHQLIHAPVTVKQLAHKARSIVDGLGAQRIACIMQGIKPSDIKVRKANCNDETRLFEWRNDESVRGLSFCKKPISETEHAIWFTKKSSDLDCLLLIGESEGCLPIGMVRFDIDRNKAEALINISIDIMFRGKGFSQKLLAAAIQYFRTTEKNMKFVAEVLEQNKPSHKLFTKLQFKSVTPYKLGIKMYELGE